MFCNNCGNKINEGAKFCRGCGTILVTEDNGKTPPPPPPPIIAPPPLPPIGPPPPIAPPPLPKVQPPPTIPPTVMVKEELKEKITPPPDGKKNSMKGWLIAGWVVAVAAVVALIVVFGTSKGKNTMTAESEKNAIVSDVNNNFSEVTSKQVTPEPQKHQPVSLTPSKIGEFASPTTEKDFDLTGYKPDPNGKFFHFESFVTLGDSQWDAIIRYEEEFTASSTLPPSKVARYDAENLRNDKHLDVRPKKFKKKE